MRDPNIFSAPVGLRHSQTMTVTRSHIVPELDPSWQGFRDMPPVFATAMMIGFIEQTCIEALRPYLASEQRTVGTHLDVSHVAATPPGMKVTAEVELISLAGKKLRFRVRCADEVDLIGEGYHERALVDSERFLARVRGKAQKIDM